VVTPAGTYSTVVNVTTQAVESWEPAPNTRYSFISRDFGNIATVTADPRFVEGLTRRGLTRPQALCVGFGPGPARNDAERGHRLLRVGCFQRGETNFWSQPVEGLVGTFDLDTGTVLDVIDEDPVPIPAVPAALPEAAPVAVEPTDPDPAISIGGGALRWNEWDLRWRMDGRVGLVLHNVTFQPDEQRGRLSVLYEAYLSEMYVPYQDPSAAWAWRTFMDSGEFGMGNTLSSLIPGVDCPPDAHFLDAAMPNAGGTLRAVERGVCLFARVPTAPVWRHGRTGAAGEEFVVRSISTVGNYDYVIDYVFRRDGSIRVDVAAAGVVLQKAVAAQTAADHHATGADAFGTLVAPGLVGVNHDHFLNFRLDLDVLGVSNRFVRERLLPVPVEGEESRTSIWERHVAVQQTEGGFTVQPAVEERWLIDAGNGRSYRIDRGNAVVDPLADPADPGLARAAWATAPFWVTPQVGDERYAGGRFVLGSTGLDDGLAIWARADRPIVDQDLVAWFTVGFHHVVRSEDLPIMPTHSASFSLVPENMFRSNPLLEN
jgi:primary-amine oxidase